MSTEPVRNPAVHGGEDQLFLSRSEQDFQRLVAYLRHKGTLAPVFDKLDLYYDPKHDEANASDPRAFCYVRPDRWFVYCSRALEDVAPRVRIGVLLHEIGHLARNAFKGDKSEVDVDTWVLDNVPEAGYHYADHEYYHMWRQEAVTAKAVEHVSRAFAGVIQNGQ